MTEATLPMVGPPMPDPRFADARILVVDDEEINLRVLAKILSAAGCTDIPHDGGPHDGGRALPERDPDLILLDLHMPKLDGFSVLQRSGLRDRAHAFVPVLVLTGDRSAAARRRRCRPAPRTS